MQFKQSRYPPIISVGSAAVRAAEYGLPEFLTVRRFESPRGHQKPFEFGGPA
jgi:hypothetical protein